MSAHHAFRCGILISLTLALAGCAGGASDSPKALAAKGAIERIDQQAEPSEQVKDVAPTDLASLAQRDVEDFMRLQSQAAAKNSASSMPDTIEPIAKSPEAKPAVPEFTDPPAKPEPIIWTDAVGKTLAAGNAHADSAVPTTDEQLTMGDDAADATEVPNSALASPGLEMNPRTGTADRMSELLVGLSAELYMRASDADQPLRELIMISATSMVDPTRKLANIEALPGLTDREREMLGAFQDFFLKLGEKLDGSEEADAAIMTALQDLQSNIVKAPTLTIPASALCTAVEGFGKYRPFAANRFLAHSGQQMVVYVEIGDFTCKQNKVGQWVTELAQQLIIYSDRDGIPVWREEWLPVVDTANKPRQDFYTTQLIAIPDALSVGKYQLKIRLRDEATGAEAEHSIEFEMVADPKLATQS